jgi:muconolactone delta-isomerase
MRILAIEHELPTPPHAKLAPLLRAEAAGVWALQKRGLIRDIWFTAADRRAILMLECPNAAEHLATLPMVQYGLIEFGVYELAGYDGYERLFATGAKPSVVQSEEPPEY